MKLRRSAFAPLEFVMALPFLVILAGIIFTVTRASLIKGQAIQQARNNAWHNRFSGAGGDLSFPGSSGTQVLGALAQRSATSGLQTASGSQTHAKVEYLAPPNQYFYFGPISAKAGHAVFSSPWDHEVMRFGGESQPAIDPRFAVFGATSVGFDVFGGLLNTLQVPPGAAGALQKAQELVSTVSNTLNSINQQISAYENQISQLETQLQNALAAVNNPLAREIRKQLARVRENLEKLKKAREELQKGMNIIP